MTLRMGILAAIFAAFAVPAGAVPLTMSIEKNGGDGSVVVSEPAGLDLQVVVVGSDNGFPFGPGVQTTAGFLYTGASQFTLVGNWIYETLDDPAWDLFGYFVGSTANFHDLSYDSRAGAYVNSGSFSFTVDPGTTFGFYVFSLDNANGRATATVKIADGIIPNPSPVPLPATVALMLPALGALGWARRRARPRPQA